MASAWDLKAPALKSEKNAWLLLSVVRVAVKRQEAAKSVCGEDVFN